MKTKTKVITSSMKSNAQQREDERIEQHRSKLLALAKDGIARALFVRVIIDRLPIDESMVDRLVEKWQHAEGGATKAAETLVMAEDATDYFRSLHRINLLERAHRLETMV